MVELKSAGVEQDLITKIDAFLTGFVEVDGGLTSLKGVAEGFERFFGQATPPSITKKLGDLDNLLVGLTGLDRRSISRMIRFGKLEAAVAVFERGIVAMAKVFVAYFDAVFKVADSEWDIVYKQQALI